MSRRFAIVFVAMAIGVACDSPTAPTQDRLTSLALSAESLIVPRNGNAQVSAEFTDATGKRDVTSEATWVSSNPSAVSVVAGRVSAVGIGTVEVVASYRGASKSVRVVARRNLALAGNVLVIDQRTASLNGVHLSVAQRGLAGWVGSDHHGDKTVRLVFDRTRTLNWAVNAAIDPGPRELLLEVWTWLPSNVADVVVDSSSTVTIIDRDTFEELSTLSLVAPPTTITGHGFVTIPIMIDIFASASLD